VVIPEDFFFFGMTFLNHTIMKYLMIAVLAVSTLFACKEEEKPKSWQLTQTIITTGVNPIGIAHTAEGIWLSDGDHNRVVMINETGSVQKTLDSLDRPMHISAQGNELVIPQYGNDEIIRWEEDVVEVMAIEDSLDAPAGVWRTGTETAIADFYNNRILYSENGSEWISFGKEGKADGEFYYPTDVQITDDRIWVADAYNNRIQAFDKTGKFLQQMGADQKMNAATGIYVSEENVFVTDFENDRILVFDLDGNLVQELSENIEKPTDLLLIEDKLYVINYRNGKINVFEWKETPAATEGGHEDHDDHDH
jgi:DNA-binding beta-propeller fold protein YncE